MEITILNHDNKFCGVYLENGILLDARAGIGQAIKEHGIQPKTVFLTSLSGAPVAGLSDLDGVPIGNVGLDETVTITQFMVGSKGDKRYGFRLSSPDGELVYAPEFDRLEKSKISGADLAILDPGDRSEVGDLAGLSHKAFAARERMVGNAEVGQTIWVDSYPATGTLTMEVEKKTAADLSDNERTALHNKANESGQDYDKLARMYIHGLESFGTLKKKPKGVTKYQYAMGIVNNSLSSKEAHDEKKCPEGMSEEDCKKHMADINKERAPNSDFLVIEPGKDGNMDKQHLQVKRNGKPDHQLMAGARAALTSNHRGNPYGGPNKAAALKKLRALYKSEGMEWDNKKTKAVDLTQQLDDIREAFRDQFASFNTGNSWVYVSRIYDEYVICEYSGQTYQVDYASEGGDHVFDNFPDWVEVETVVSYQPVEKSRLVVTKEQDGKRHWMSVSSSDFRDLDGEVVSTTAMDFAIAVAKRRGDAGNLVWDHYDELPLGPCTSQTRVGRFLVESGDFSDTVLATKAADKLESAPPGKYRISLGFKYWKGTQSEDGTYYLMDIFHRAVTDHPSNAATGIEVTKSMKQLTPDILKTIGKDLDMTEDELKELMAGIKPQESKKESGDPEVKVVHKENEPETPPVTSVEDQIKALVTAVESLKTQFATLKEQTATEVKDKLLAVLKDAPAGDITRPTTTSPELSAEEKARLEALSKNKEEKEKANQGFERYRQMFQSVPAN